MRQPKTTFIRRHNPLISARIEFRVASPPPLPLITPRIEFSPARLHRHRVRIAEHQEPELSVSSGSSRSLPRLSALKPSARSKIPKPPGEPGRPGSGGHCVESELVKNHNWSKEDFDALTDTVRAEARNKLDTTVSFRSQDKHLIEDICDRMMTEEQWPVLKSYEDCWPVRSILKLALKYGAEASRRANTKDMNKRLREALSHSSPENS